MGGKRKAVRKPSRNHQVFIGRLPLCSLLRALSVLMYSTIPLLYLQPFFHYSYCDSFPPTTTFSVPFFFQCNFLHFLFNNTLLFHTIFFLFSNSAFLWFLLLVSLNRHEIFEIFPDVNFITIFSSPWRRRSTFFLPQLNDLLFLAHLS